MKNLTAIQKGTIIAVISFWLIFLVIEQVDSRNRAEARSVRAKKELAAPHQLMPSAQKLRASRAALPTTAANEWIQAIDFILPGRPRPEVEQKGPYAPQRSFIAYFDSPQGLCKVETYRQVAEGQISPALSVFNSQIEITKPNGSKEEFIDKTGQGNQSTYFGSGQYTVSGLYPYLSATRLRVLKHKSPTEPQGWRYVLRLTAIAAPNIKVERLNLHSRKIGIVARSIANEAFLPFIGLQLRNSAGQPLATSFDFVNELNFKAYVVEVDGPVDLVATTQSTQDTYIDIYAFN